MTETTTIAPNANTQSSTANSQPVVPSLDAIAAKMTAMRETTQRNQIRPTEQTATGADESADDSITPVVTSDDVPEIDGSDSDISESSNQEADAQDEDSVSTDSNDNDASEIIDFIDFAESNPNAKFKFMRNGKEVILDAKKAAAILGQGSAIHEDARQLKIDRAEFDEFRTEAHARQEGLTLAMEFTIEPRLQTSYDEILKTQGYQTTFQQQLKQTRDPGEQARIRASMQQNEAYIARQQKTISQLQPAVQQFRDVRAQQVTSALDSSRKAFTDKELKNEFVYNELRGKLSKIWPKANNELIPGVTNIDLISSDENLLSLVRDGLRYRDKPSVKSAGASMAALTNRKGSSNSNRATNDNISKLREQANAGDKKASDNLLMQRLQSIRANGGRR